MMIHAYQETHVNKVQAMLGTAFDYAINTCKINGDNFAKMFIASGICKRVENGEPAIVSGKSGIEIVQEIVLETMGKELDIEPAESFGRSVEYWVGWALAYYQWHSNRSFSDIIKVVSYAELEKMYYPLHEADITKLLDILDERIKEYYTETNLKRIRTAYGCSQSELSKKAGVSLRSIQMYEQRNKDINKASVETIYRMAKVLGCTIEDLIEK